MEARRSSVHSGHGRGCLIAGGETTVTVTGGGLGGRNTELALAFANEIRGMEGITILSAGTDGTDGPTDAAGAIVDGHTIIKAEAAGLQPEAYLRNNDSYRLLQATDDLFFTGPTGTNVMDLQIILFD
jgi:glycerate-2-kinase